MAPRAAQGVFLSPAFAASQTGVANHAKLDSTGGDINAYNNQNSSSDSSSIPVIGPIIQDIIDFFGGGGGEPSIPRQFRYGRHPIFDFALGSKKDITAGETSNAYELPMHSFTPGAIMSVGFMFRIPNFPQDMNTPPEGFEERGPNFWDPKSGLSWHPRSYGEPEPPKGKHFDLTLRGTNLHLSLRFVDGFFQIWNNKTGWVTLSDPSTLLPSLILDNN